MIVPVEDMPFDENGRPVDIVLKPARRTFTYEHRADPRDPPRLCSQGRGERIGRMLDAQVSAQGLRDFLDKVYNTSGRKEDLGSLSDETCLRWPTTCVVVCPRQRLCSTVHTKTRFATCWSWRRRIRRPDPALRRPYRRGVRASRHGGLHVHDQAQSTWLMTRCMPVRLVRIAWLTSSRWGQGTVRRPAFR